MALLIRLEADYLICSTVNISHPHQQENMHHVVWSTASMPVAVLPVRVLTMPPRHLLPLGLDDVT